MEKKRDSRVGAANYHEDASAASHTCAILEALVKYVSLGWSADGYLREWGMQDNVQPGRRYLQCRTSSCHLVAQASRGRVQ